LQPIEDAIECRNLNNDRKKALLALIATERTIASQLLRLFAGGKMVEVGWIRWLVGRRCGIVSRHHRFGAAARSRQPEDVDTVPAMVVPSLALSPQGEP